MEGSLAFNIPFYGWNFNSVWIEAPEKALSQLKDFPPAPANHYRRRFRKFMHSMSFSSLKISNLCADSRNVLSISSSTAFCWEEITNRFQEPRYLGRAVHRKKIHKPSFFKKVGLH